ncbi:hypothetical protein [Streptomyces sp. NPDC056452]|uniref:hypothetical protein n=1 Tax=Streptomyces sp. NPDC056452 TaxID=3345821 RepID=UPI003682FF7A
MTDTETSLRLPGFSITGYGGYKELGIALAVLGLSVVLWLYRTNVQDRRTSKVSAPGPPRRSRTVPGTGSTRSPGNPPTPASAANRSLPLDA